MQRYSTLQIVLHWASAILVLLSLLVGTFVLDRLPNDAGKIVPLGVHMIAGVIIGLVIVARLIVRLTSPQPERPTIGNTLLDRLATIVHGAMYLGVIGMVGSGVGLAIISGLPGTVFGHYGAALPHDFWQYPPRFVHAAFAKFLIALISLHVLAAFFHQFVRKDGVLSRMWFAKSAAPNGRA